MIFRKPTTLAQYTYYSVLQPFSKLILKIPITSCCPRDSVTAPDWWLHFVYIYIFDLHPSLYKKIQKIIVEWVLHI